MNLTKGNMLEFVRQVDKEFPIALSDKVDLELYVEKLLKYGIIYYSFKNNKLTGAVAGYINSTSKIAYISMVAVLQEERGKGIASKLIKRFIKQCKEKKYLMVHVYTHKENQSACCMYEKLGFKNYHVDDEPRPEDIHLVYTL